MNRPLIVTGTDTDIGKTVFAAGLAAALGAHYWKPVQAGLDDGSDSGRVAALGVPKDKILPEAYRLTTPCSPHRAAEIDGVTIDPAQLDLPDIAGPLVVEGAGGPSDVAVARVIPGATPAQWACPHCTFANLLHRTQTTAAGLSICELCTRTARVQ